MTSSSSVRRTSANRAPSVHRSGGTALAAGSLTARTKIVTARDILGADTMSDVGGGGGGFTLQNGPTPPKLAVAMAASERERSRMNRRSSISVVSASPRELDERSRRARDSLIFRADDFVTGSRRSFAAAPFDGDLGGGGDGGYTGRSSTTVRSSLPPTTPSSIYRRRASVAGPSSTPARRRDDDYLLTNTNRKTTSFDKSGREYDSLDGLRARMNTAREQMSKHRTLIDRYLPAYTGSPNDHDVQFEVENKVNELAFRMPQLDPTKRYVRDRDDNDRKTTIRLVEPYKPLPKINKVDYSPLPPVRTPFRPKISDVRKRARSVLCKVKGDPRYFDL